jgi:DNA-binding CsgD family transcriptional regulator
VSALGVATSESYALLVPSLVGRDAELATVASFLHETGGPTALVVVGEPGIGKTTVWEEALRRAGDAGDKLVLVARPTETEAKLSFAALADLVSPIDAEAFDALPGPQRRALDVALLRVEAQATPPERRTVGTALLSLLRSLAPLREVIIAIDDLQWLDKPSAAALEFAIRRLGDERIRLIASVREDAEASSFVSSLGSGRVLRIELGPVSVASLHGIVTQRLGRDFSRPAVVRIAQASGGNPLYALEIARLVADGELGSAMPVPEGVRTLVARRVEALPAETHEALLRVSALARPDLVAVDAEALAPAEEAGLVRVDANGRIAFTHPLYASAVYASAAYARRRATHTALAEVVHDPEERARHLALSCDGPDEDVAAAVEDAARRARARGASDTAAELCALALQLTPESGTEFERRRIALAEQLLLAGDFERAGDELRALSASLTPGDVRARVLLMLAEVDYWRLGESAALELGEQAIADASDPQLLARCHAMIAMHAGTRDVPRAAAAATRALEYLEASPEPDPALLSLVLSSRVRAQLFAGNGLDRVAAERALALEGDALPAAVDTRMNFKLGQWLRYVDDLDGARLRLAKAETSAREEGDESSLPNILLNRALAECWAGNLPLASELGDQTREAFRQVGIASAATKVWKAYVDAHRGRLDAVREAALEREDVDEPILLMLWERTLGLAELSAGDVTSADRHLAVAMRLLDEMEFSEPAVWRVDGDAAEAALGAGDLQRAETLVDRFESRAARSQIPWSLAVSARCRALLHASRGELDEALKVVEGAIVAHELCPVQLELARTLLAHGQVLRRLKQKRLARASIERAQAIFEDLGAALWAARARDELDRVASRSAPVDLSATELRIAELAATGRTNQEIAAEVFVTQKTVEANLARAYRKLGIRSRAQLAHALDARASEVIP